MYSPEAKSTAIAYRLIHENLPRFIDNMAVFEAVAASPIAEQFSALYKEFEKCLNVTEIGEVFALKYYNYVLTQSNIDIYNAIIGGKVLADGTKIKGLNEYINLYNQQQTEKSKPLPKFKALYKQILSDRNSTSWLPEQFRANDDEAVLEAIQKAYQELEDKVLSRMNDGEHSLKSILQSLSDYDLNKIYIRNDSQISDLSQKIFGHWGFISDALLEYLKQQVPKKSKKETDEAYEDRLKTILKSQGSISIAQINEAVNRQNSILEYFAAGGVVPSDSASTENFFDRIEHAYSEVKELLNTPYPPTKNLVQDKVNIEKIKNLLDSIKDLQHFIKPLLGEGNEPDKDGKFYGEFMTLWNELDRITPLYNKVRNYMTRKPYSTEKIKLNFGNPTLMDGWDLNKERHNSAVILRKNGFYYLAIMDKRHNRVFDAANMPSDGDCYEKMEYKLIPGYRQLFHVFFSKKGIQELAPSEQILKIKNNKTYTGKNFNIDDCRRLIDFFKDSINKHKDWRKFDFAFSDTDTYEDISGFYREVEQQGYKLSFRNVAVDYIDSLVNEGKIYLFQIYNKDFSSFSKGMPNMHTLYWKMLFDERNLADVVYKLNGKAEVFFRKASISYDRPTHPANQQIENKNALNQRSHSRFTYDLIKDRRYTVDKFQFHVPITLNFKSISNSNININRLVNEYIKQCDDLHIIGIDRGERHLLYLTVIDLKGRIKEQYSLNEIVNFYNGNEYRTNYHDLLSKREDERMKARQSWQTIENIKELKDGYLSQVIHKIADLMVKYNAIVVLEDLNYGFMRGRQKVEKSVYQKFEKMLVDKLNYLVDKKKKPEEEGGLLNAYQLTNKFENFQTLGKQSGFLFYIPAWNTSKIDPVTGFVNLLDTRYETKEKAKSFFAKFETICYNHDKDWFEFSLDYDKFTTKAGDSRTHWTLCTYGKRIETIRDENQNSQWTSREIDLTQELKDFFAKYQIDICTDLKEKIIKQDSADFFKGLLRLLKLTLQMRNSKTGTDIDYLQSPVSDDNGSFYNSETCDGSLPKNADANGAYNIARKGLWLVRKIKEAEPPIEKLPPISNNEWLQFAQTKPYLD